MSNTVTMDWKEMKEQFVNQNADLLDPEFSENAVFTLEKRYLRKDEQGNIVESPKGMLCRVACSIAGTPSEAWDFYTLMAKGEFFPNSPTLMNAGLSDGQLAACFVLPVDDSMESIFDAIKYAALIHKSGGGTGFSFSRIRPANSSVKSTGGVASGPVSFMRIFNTAIEQVKQGGRRRGAGISILRIDHPDILEFIRAKEKDGEFTNFNFSVGVTDDFMEAALAGQDYDLINPATNEKAGTLNAKDVFELLVKKAWESGEPGIVFLDAINRVNPTPSLGQIEATNPCGEQPLLPYEACNLGSINLAKFVKGTGFDLESLGKCVRTAVRFLDRVIDASVYPLPQINEMVRKTRKIGLGVMGWADALFILGIPYDSDEAVKLAEEIMKFITKTAREESFRLGAEHGCAAGCDCRNATVTTIAPTGTLSILGDCSSGVEPLFALSMTKNILDGANLKVVNPYFEKALADLTPEERRDALAWAGEHGNLSGMPKSPALEKIARCFRTAHEIAPEWHLAMQAAFQKHTDNAVSKTVNLSHDATVDMVRDLYIGAFRKGLKGLTVYRDGSRSSQPLRAGKKPAEKTEPKSVKSQARPDVLTGFTSKVRTGLGAMYLTINELDGKPFEVFATVGKSGKSVMAKAEAIGRLVSLALRNGIEVAEIVKQLKGIGGEHPAFAQKRLFLSIPDAVAWTLEERYLSAPVVNEPTFTNETCPDCGSVLELAEGCAICKNCGYSRCG